MSDVLDPRLQILLVEDNQGDARLLRLTLDDALADRGGTFVLTCAKTLEEGLRHLEREPVDVLLLDLMLPDSAGLDTIRRVRRQQTRLPVVVLTGLADDDVALQAMRCGADDYLVKGQVDHIALLRVLRQAVARADYQKALQAEQAERSRLAGALLAARTVAHLVNNQLMVTVGFAELLSVDAGLSPTTRQRAALVLDGALQAAETIRQLQQIVRLKEDDSTRGVATIDLPRSTN